MSGGDVRVLHQEAAGQESPRIMPAWKREILERRKAAKGGGAAGAAESAQQRVNNNGEVTGNGPKNNDNGTTAAGGSSSCSRNYTITTASQHFAGKRGGGNLAASPPDLSPVKTNKDPWMTTGGDPPHDSEREGHESLVLHDSLGPLQENPFIKLEKERKRRQDRENAARPVQHILELYGSVPGIRTIRAENIIIIESDPDYFPEASGFKAGSTLLQNGVSGYSSLNDLLDRRGSAVTEIRAAEVVIYDTTLSKSEENLSTLGYSDHEASSYDTGEGQGRVSRILQKFDCNYGKLQKKSRSTENLLDLGVCASGRPRPRPNKPQPDLVPKFTSLPRPGSSPARRRDKTPSSSSSSVFQSSQSSKPKTRPPPPACEADGAPCPPAASPPQTVSSYRQRFEGSGSRGGGGAVNRRDETDRVVQPKLVRERDWESADVSPKSKVPCSPETRRARAESPTSPLFSQRSPLSSTEFQIRPSPRPDLSLIPDADVQARALANLRLQSRNSFTVIPKGRLAAATTTPSAPGSTAPSSPVKSPPPTRRVAEVPASGVPSPPILTPSPSPAKRKGEVKVAAPRAARPSSKAPDPSSSVVVATTTPPPSTPSSPSPVTSPVPSSTPPPSSPVTSTPPPAPPSPVPSTPEPPSSPALEEPPVDQLPITNIDDIEVEHPQSAPTPSPVVQRKKGNTFTVVPKRKAESQVQPASPEPQQVGPPGGGALPGSLPPLAPYAQLGSLLKKRYPAVEEIEVIGGYLSLGKSCLSRMSSPGKKMTISFNESSLHSTYEYPSESSVWDSGEEDEEDEGKGGGPVPDDQPSMVGRIHIPRPSFSSSPTHSNSSTDLSNYTPKHSVDFSAWQEHKLDDPIYQAETNSQQPMSEEVIMLTPADGSSLSDFSSEPALYF